MEHSCIGPSYKKGGKRKDECMDEICNRNCCLSGQNGELHLHKPELFIYLFISIEAMNMLTNQQYLIRGLFDA